MPSHKQQGRRNSLPPKRYRTNTSRRLVSRPSYKGISPSLHSKSSLSSLASSSTLDAPELDNENAGSSYRHRRRRHDRASHILSQVAEWLHNEKVKKAARRFRKHGNRAKIASVVQPLRDLGDQIRHDQSEGHKSHHGRTDSDLSESNLALEELERIISRRMDLEDDGAITPTEDMKGSSIPRRKSSSKYQKHKKTLRKSSIIHSSDTEYQEPDIDVPSAEVVLDNSRTMSYGGGTLGSAAGSANPKKRASREKDCWLQFQYEILRLTHTLRLKAWRRLPLERSEDIEVERLSGALTNAVYVVSPPSTLPESTSSAQDSVVSLEPKKPPP